MSLVDLSLQVSEYLPSRRQAAFGTWGCSNPWQPTLYTAETVMSVVVCSLH